MLLKIEKKSVGAGVAVLAMSGRITMGRDCQTVEWCVNDLLKENQRKVIFDMAGVNHIDSTGVGIVVMCSGKIHQSGGQLRVAGAQGMVEQVLKLTKVDQIIDFHANVDDAARSFEPGA